MENCPRRREQEEQKRILYRGQTLDKSDLQKIRRILRCAKGQNLRQVCESVCRAFGWYRPNGELRETSARALLRRLARRGLIPLDSPRRAQSSQVRTEKTGVPRRAAPEEWPRLSQRCVAEQGQGLALRPMLTSERGLWRAHMDYYHYLGCGRFVGESICYVALLGGQIVGLLAWAAAALKCGVRDRYLGWDEVTKATKLGFVVNNVRFLVLPWIQEKNLASQILAANLQRLSADWERRYGHAVYLAETFVDSKRFRGTCYRASNWLLLGETRGWARRGATYQHHGERKLVFVYPLSPRAVDFLRAPEARKTEVRRTTMIDVATLPLKGKGSLVEEFEALPDFRKPQGVRFSLCSILAIAACAALSGAKSFAAMAQWAGDIPREVLLRLGCRRKNPPSQKTFRRILSNIGLEQFEDRVGQWFARRTALAGQGVALDGKTVRGSADGESPATQLLSAFTQKEGVVLAETRVADKTNEIPCVKPLLEKLELAGAVVTADALHTQKETARYIVEDKKADYVFTVKDNQPTLRDDIDLLKLEAFPPSGDHAEQRARPDRSAPDLGE